MLERLWIHIISYTLIIDLKIGETTLENGRMLCLNIEHAGTLEPITSTPRHR